MTQPPPEPSTAMVTVGTHPVPATRDNVEVMSRFVQVMDPKAAPNARWALAVVACRLGLHPLNNEVILYEGQPYITIQGRRRLAERTGDVAAIQPWIVTDEEERTGLGANLPGDIVAGCRLFRKSSELPTIQYGIVRQHERWPSPAECEKLGITKDVLDGLRTANDPDGLFAHISAAHPPKIRPIVLQPTIMAMKRAEARALDSLAGVPLPTYDPDVGPVTSVRTPPHFRETDDGSQPPPEAEAPQPEPENPPPPDDPEAPPQAAGLPPR